MIPDDPGTGRGFARFYFHESRFPCCTAPVLTRTGIDSNLLAYHLLLIYT